MLQRLRNILVFLFSFFGTFRQLLSFRHFPALSGTFLWGVCPTSTKSQSTKKKAAGQAPWNSKKSGSDNTNETCIELVLTAARLPSVHVRTSIPRRFGADTRARGQIYTALATLALHALPRARVSATNRRGIDGRSCTLGSRVPVSTSPMQVSFVLSDPDFFEP